MGETGEPISGAPLVGAFPAPSDCIWTPLGAHTAQGRRRHPEQEAPVIVDVTSKTQDGKPWAEEGIQGVEVEVPQSTEVLQFSDLDGALTSSRHDQSCLRLCGHTPGTSWT